MPIITAVSSPTTALITSTSDASGNISYVTANTTAMVIDTNQNTKHTGSISSVNTFGFKNRIINGGMVIDQRNNGASVTPTATQYALDRWLVALSQSSKYSVQQNAGSVTPPVGFTNYLGITSSSAYTSISTDYFALVQRIEGFNVADLGWGTANAKTVTISFQVYSSLTGTFSGSLLNGAETRCYPFTYSIPVANTWTTISVTIAGDTTGTWLTTNGIGLEVLFNLGSGSTKLGSANSWQAAGYLGTTGSVSVVGTSGATFYITGVQLEVGTQATSFDYRPYGTELALCQRYLPAFNATGNQQNGFIGYVQVANSFRTILPFKVSTRVPATGITVASPTSFAVGWNGSGQACTGVTFVGSGTESGILEFAITSNGTVGQSGYAYATASGCQILFTGCEL